MTEAGILLLAFVVGGIPFSNLVARRWRGVDLRRTGTGTVSGTSLYYVAGFPALVLAGILDVAKGAVGPLLAGTDRPVLAAFAGGLAVAGHNWSPFLRGAGGRGIAPALGALLVNAWPGAVLLLGALTISRFFKQSGLGSFIGEVALTPVLAITSGPNGALAGAAIAVPMLLKRVLGNAKPAEPSVRTYAHRLVFDHDPGAATR
jgi:glycerol-3-phosphate acyltransferase PlsY